MQHTTRTRPPQHGFTLLELLVVIAIIGVFASVILIGTAPSRDRANVAATELTLNQVKNAMELYRATFEEYAPIGTDFCNICAFWGPGNPAWDAIPVGGPHKYNSMPYTNGSWDNDVIGALDAVDFLPSADNVLMDPWGNEFLYDKNQRFSCYTWSPICSRGPNEVLETPHCPAANSVPRAGGDDICIFLQP